MTVQPSILQRLLEPVWNMLPSSSLNNDTIHLRRRDSEKSYLEMAGDVIGYVKQFFEPLWNKLPSSINNETIHLGGSLRGRDSEKGYLGGLVAVVATGVCMALILKFIANLSKTTSLSDRTTTI